MIKACAPSRRVTPQAQTALTVHRPGSSRNSRGSAGTAATPGASSGAAKVGCQQVSALLADSARTAASLINAPGTSGATR